MLNKKKKMPVLFVGHGSPMNAIENNKYTKGWEKIVKEIPKPKPRTCSQGKRINWGFCPN